MNEGTWVQGKSMNVMHQTGNVAWSIFDADYGKYNRMSLENGTGGDMEVTVTITDGKISDIVVNSHAESSDIGAPALDKLIQNAIDHLLTNRTSFLVAHRLSTIRKADVILVVKDGHIVEQGKHEELLRRKGYYHDLYSKQFAQENAARILGEGSAQ